MVKWSHQGTFMAAVRYAYILICRVDGVLVPVAVCNHPSVSHIDFSPQDNYLVTCSAWPGEVTLRIFHVETGALLKEFTGCDHDFLGLGVHHISDLTLPLIRWSVDDKYFAMVENYMLSIYATDEAFSSCQLITINNVIDFRWSPTDPVIALLQYDDFAGDIQMNIIIVSDGKNMGNKKMEGVGHFIICWHPQGKYVACTFSSLGGIKSMDTGILILEVGGQEAPCSTATFGKRCSLLAFSFEPQGKRFTVLYGCKQEKFIRIMDLDGMNYNLHHSLHLSVLANALVWSPIGGQIVFSGCGDFLLYDVNKMEVLVKKEYTPMAVEWSPSGRFVATYGPEHKIAVWHCSGRFMYRISVEDGRFGHRHPQLFWCPPACSLNYRAEFWNDELMVIGETWKLVTAYKKQIGAYKSEETKELQLVGASDKSKKKKELLEMDFYPDCKDAEKGHRSMEPRALKLSFSLLCRELFSYICFSVRRRLRV